jgi:superfamily II DNA/RNA helicase
MGLTATPLDDGRPRRLWSQLDLLAPGGFSHSYSNFAHRYCAARPGTYGGLEDGGASNIKELKARCSFFVHEVPYSESHSSLPSTRVQVDYLTNTELNRADRFSDEQTFTQAVRQMNKEVGNRPDGRERVVEVRLAEACSRKRRYVIEEAIEGLKGGGKVVIFTARRRETELWAHQLRQQLGKGDEAQKDVPVWMAHGGVAESERDEMIDAFRNSDKACCLVATGQSVGTGVDGMQTANLAIFAMLPWKPGDFLQWKGRFDRLGGSPTLLKVVVAQGTYDERVVQILVDKFGPIETFLKADELDGLGDKLLGMEDEEALVSSIISKLEVA